MNYFSGGDELKARLAETGERLSTAKSVQVGFLEGSTEPDGTSIPLIASIQEFGAPAAGIPPRPYFRTMIADKKDSWGDAAAKQLIAADYDAEIALGRIGMGIKGQLQQSIIDTNSPPLSPVTLMLRKMRSEDQTLVVTAKTVGEAARRVAAGESSSGVSTKPLVDTGAMLNSVDFEVLT